MTSRRDPNLVEKTLSGEHRTRLLKAVDGQSLKTTGFKLINIETQTNLLSSTICLVDHFTAWMSNNPAFSLCILVPSRLEAAIVRDQLSPEQLSASPTPGKICLTTFAEAPPGVKSSSGSSPKALVLMVSGANVHSVDTIVKAGIWLDWAIEKTSEKSDEAAVNIITLSLTHRHLLREDTVLEGLELLDQEEHAFSSSMHEVHAVRDFSHELYQDEPLDIEDEEAVLERCIQIILGLASWEDNAKVEDAGSSQPEKGTFRTVACFMPKLTCTMLANFVGQALPSRVKVEYINPDTDIEDAMIALDGDGQARNRFLCFDRSVTMIPPIANLDAVLVVAVAEQHVFDPESSQIVLTDVTLTRDELVQSHTMFSKSEDLSAQPGHLYQQLTCINLFSMAKATAMRRETPRPPAFHRDMMSLLFRLIATFPRRRLYQIPVVLPRDWRMVDEFVSRLMAMKCVTLSKGQFQTLSVSPGRGGRMRKLMGTESDFHALYLLGGLSKHTPPAIKRVIIRLCAIVSKDNYDFISFESRDTPAPMPFPTSMQLDVECLGLGNQLRENGGLWLALGLWEAQMIKSAPRDGVRRLFDDRVVLYHHDCEKLQNRVNELESAFGLGPAEQYYWKSLSDQNILEIEMELVQSRVHNLVFFPRSESDPSLVDGLNWTSAEWIAPSTNEVIDWAVHVRNGHSGFFAIYLWLEKSEEGGYIPMGLTKVSEEAVVRVLKELASTTGPDGETTLQLSMLRSKYPDMSAP